MAGKARRRPSWKKQRNRAPNRASKPAGKPITRVVAEAAASAVDKAREVIGSAVSKVTG
jgi:hypothetical protein